MNRIRNSFVLLTAGLFLAAPSIAAEKTREVVQMRGDVTIKAGEAVDQAVALMGSVRVEGTVRENAVSVFGDVEIGPKGQVQGDAVSIGGRVIRVDGSKVGGKEVALGISLAGMEKLLLVGSSVAAGIFALLAGGFILGYTIGAVALVILVLTLFDKQVAATQKMLVERPGQSFLLGLAGFICFIPVLILLTITIIGIPLAFAMAIVFAAAIVLGTVAVGQWVGTEVAQRFNWNLKPVWTGLLGMTLLFLVSLIPVIGWIIHIGAHMFGLGAVMQSRFGTATMGLNPKTNR